MSNVSTLWLGTESATPRVHPVDTPVQQPLPARDLVLLIEPDRPTLHRKHSDTIRRWVTHWRRTEPDALILLAESGPSRAGRVSRLRSLRDLLVRCGFSEQRVRYTGDRVRTADHLVGGEGNAACSAWLKVISAQRAEQTVHPIHRFFSHRARANRSVCIAAS